MGTPSQIGRRAQPAVRVAGVPSPVVCEGLVPPDESHQDSNESQVRAARVIGQYRSVIGPEGQSAFSVGV